MRGWLGSLLCTYLPCAMHGLGAHLYWLRNESAVGNWVITYIYNIYIHGMVQQYCDNPPFHTGTRPGLYPSFGIHTGTLTRVRPGLNPGSRPCLRAGFRPGFATRLHHNRIVSVKKWRKTDERGLSARRGCFCRSGARIGSSVSCRGSKEQCRISDDCRRAGKARLSAHARVMSAENKSSQEKVQVHR